MTGPTFGIDQLDELDRLMQAAWPGPWEVREPDAWPQASFSPFIHTGDGMLLENRANMAAMVALRNAYPRLRDALRAHVDPDNQEGGTA